jgi:hypothetical protein
MSNCFCHPGRAAGTPNSITAQIRQAGGGDSDRDVQRPEQVNLEKIKNSLPVGNITVKAVKGGLDVDDPENKDSAVIASAAIAVRIEMA